MEIIFFFLIWKREKEHINSCFIHTFCLIQDNPGRCKDNWNRRLCCSSLVCEEDLFVSFEEQYIKIWLLILSTCGENTTITAMMEVTFFSLTQSETWSEMNSHVRRLALISGNFFSFLNWRAFTFQIIISWECLFISEMSSCFHNSILQSRSSLHLSALNTVAYIDL